MDILIPKIRHAMLSRAWSSAQCLQKPLSSISDASRNGLRARILTLEKTFPSPSRPFSTQYTASRALRRSRVGFTYTNLPSYKVRLIGTAPSIQPIPSSSLRQGFFPSRTSKNVGYWLFGSAASVFGIVVLGGLTRLTESG